MPVLTGGHSSVTSSSQTSIVQYIYAKSNKKYARTVQQTDIGSNCMPRMAKA